MSGFDPRRMLAALPGDDHNAMIGCRYVAHGGDWAEVAMDYDPALAADGDTGILAGGPIITLMDMASGLAVWTRLGRFRRHATLDMRIDYLRAPAPGRAVFGRSHCYRLTDRIAFYDGMAHDGDADRPVMRVSGTYMFIEPA